MKSLAGRLVGIGLLADGAWRVLRRSERGSWERVGGVAEAAAGVALVARGPVRPLDLYTPVAPLYDAMSRLWRGRMAAPIHASFDRRLQEWVTPDTRILDIGCGTGANLARLHALDLPFSSYAGVDLTEAMLRQARAKVRPGEPVRLLQLDVTRDPLPAGPFDLVISTWMFSHLRDPAAVVAAAYGRLRPGGRMLLLFIAAEGAASARWKRLLAGFSSWPVPEGVYRGFAGFTAAETYDGGSLALVRLARPEAPAGAAGSGAAAATR